MSNFHLQEIQTLQNSLREREEYITELENRLRALWDKYEVDRKHYMARITRLEGELERTKQDRNAIAKNTREPLLLQLDHAADRIKRLEEAGDRMRLYCADPDDCFAWDKAKEDKP